MMKNQTMKQQYNIETATFYNFEDAYAFGVEIPPCDIIETRELYSPYLFNGKSLMWEIKYRRPAMTRQEITIREGI